MELLHANANSIVQLLQIYKKKKNACTFKNSSASGIYFFIIIFRFHSPGMYGFLSVDPFVLSLNVLLCTSIILIKMEIKIDWCNQIEWSANPLCIDCFWIHTAIPIYFWGLACILAIISKASRQSIRNMGPRKQHLYDWPTKDTSKQRFLTHINIQISMNRGSKTHSLISLMWQCFICIARGWEIPEPYAWGTVVP